MTAHSNMDLALCRKYSSFFLFFCFPLTDHPFNSDHQGHITLGIIYQIKPSAPFTVLKWPYIFTPEQMFVLPPDGGKS